MNHLRKTPVVPNQPRVTWASGAIELAARDPVLRNLVDVCGLPSPRAASDSPFAALVRSVLYQQLAGSAAAAIHARVIAAVNGDVSPEAILKLAPEQLRAAGVSGAKEASIRDLAAKVRDREVVLDARRLNRASDEEIIVNLSMVRGIGRWTAQMFLMFQLRRLDVWPAADLGVRRGYGLAWGPEIPTARELEPLGAAFQPYRSIAAWYCWRACEVFAGAGDSALTR
jgi:DNA-3-methyladenine glycosylase II